VLFRSKLLVVTSIVQSGKQMLLIVTLRQRISFYV